MESHEPDENFTNFSITEILKPGFGSKQLTTGVLNLSKGKSTYRQTNNLQLPDFHTWTAHSLHNLGLQFSAYSSKPCHNYVVNKHCSELPDIGVNNTNTLLRNQHTHFGLNLDIRNKTDTHSNTSDSQRELCGSDGESESSPATSPAGSPGTSPNGSNSENGAQDEKLWPAWVYCTRYSDRPSAGNKMFILFFFLTVYCRKINKRFVIRILLSMRVFGYTSNFVRIKTHTQIQPKMN